ncbi:MAG TPA: glucose-1-phosphate thymidylyltransferase [Thermoleophilia bacterium]|nr:glucose-1-phosphate thymidylyltransferase [Thermoleophilia bacterium]
MKGLILSGGAGTRLRPITHTSAKQLVPVANKPILFYGLEAMRAAGIEEVGIVVGETRAEIEAAVGDGASWGLRVTYIPQEAPLGLAHAVLISEDYLCDEPFVMYLGDNLLKEGIARFVARFVAGRPDALILLQKVAEPRSYGIAELGPEGAVTRLVEKPDQPRSDLALVGVYLFTSAIFDSVKAITPSSRGELEITDAIQDMVDRGLRVEPHIVSGWWKDTGKLEDILEANRLILSSLESDVGGQLIDTQLEGSVVVAEGARLERCTVRGPAIIGSGCVITDTFIGPYTAIDCGVVIEGAEIEHSIILAGSRIARLNARITDSLIGKNCTIGRSDARPVAYRFMVGDSSQIGVL